jgi:hypothetical protein
MWPQQLGEAGDQRLHTGADDRRAEEHRVHERPSGLSGKLRTQVGI